MITKALISAFALFIFILPVPGTIALRYSLMLVLLCLTIVSLRKTGPEGDNQLANRAKPLVLGLALITAWFVFQATAISEETAWALKELANQWLPAILVACFGMAMVRVLARAGWNRSQILGLVALCMLVQVIASFVVVIPIYAAEGAFPQGKTWFTAGKLEISYWNNLLLTLLAVDALSRWLYQKSITRLPIGLVAAGIILIFTSNLAFGARAGLIGSGILIVSLAVLVLLHERSRLGPFRVAAFILSSTLLVVILAEMSYRSDPRWASFEETAEIAWTQKGGAAWLNPDEVPLPDLASGVPAEASAYYRLSWIRAGLQLIGDYPLGVGYGRNAFGHALRKTTETHLGHAHSGIIDLTVGAGLPGLLLWLGLLASLVFIGLRRYFRQQDALGLVMVFAVGGFFGRMLIDSINRDHMLMLYFLIIGILIAMPEESVDR